jgi:hypothetical protein
VIVDELEHHRGLQAEAGARDKAVAEALVKQFKPLTCAQIRKLSGELCGIGFRCGFHGEHDMKINY